MVFKGMFNIRISDLPPYGKLFVGLFTTLMLVVCLWAMVIFYLDKGLISEEGPAEYEDEYGVVDDEGLFQDVEEILADSEAVLAPVWDSDVAGQQVMLDSEEMVEGFVEYEAEEAMEQAESEDWCQENGWDHLRHNVGLAHTHINGQTFLFFALGFVFLFTSVKPRVKKITLGVFSVGVLVHAIGLTGEGFHWFFDGILAVSGVVILASIIYMALVIYMDLGRKQAAPTAAGES
jgi:hypothetical protein